MKLYLYTIVLLALCYVVSADYCYPFDNSSIRNMSGNCYFNDSKICTNYSRVHNDILCEVFYEGYVDSYYKPDGLCKGTLSRNLSNKSDTIIFKFNVTRGKTTEYIEKNVTRDILTYMDRPVDREVIKFLYSENCTNTTVVEGYQDIDMRSVRYGVLLGFMIAVMIAALGILAFIRVYNREGGLRE